MAGIFARLERNEILQALSVDVDAERPRDQTLTSAVINSLAGKFARRREQKTAELRKVNDLAKRLRSYAQAYLEPSFERIEQTVAGVGRTKFFVQPGGPDHDNAHWYKFEVISSAKEAGKFANFSEAHYFVKGSIHAGRERLVFVTSFHHVGRELTGIMEATAFSKLESFEDSEDRRSADERFLVCSMEPFVFTHLTDPSEVELAFARWLDEALDVALKEFGDRL